jgi:hypothetical protein
VPLNNARQNFKTIDTFRWLTFRQDVKAGAFQEDIWYQDGYHDGIIFWAINNAREDLASRPNRPYITYHSKLSTSNKLWQTDRVLTENDVKTGLCIITMPCKDVV